MTLKLGRTEIEQVHDHVRRAYPEEGCGLLVGRESGGERRVERVVGTENLDPGARERRYVIAPEEFLAAERRARDDGLEVLGFFHSHPDHPARPSAFDLERAWAYYSYLIVCVSKGDVTEQRSWRLRGDRREFDPEALEIEPGAGHAAGR